MLSLLLAVELEVEDDDPLVELDELDELDEASLDSLDSDDDEDESLLSLESLVSLVSLVSLSPELLLVFENERLLSELSGA